jgi:hypothetical protein
VTPHHKTMNPMHSDKSSVGVSAFTLSGPSAARPDVAPSAVQPHQKRALALPQDVAEGKRSHTATHRQLFGGRDKAVATRKSPPRLEGPGAERQAFN